MGRERIGPEFLLLVRCCQWNFTSAKDCSEPEIPAGLDWSHFLNQAHRHRVQGLVWNALAGQRDQLPEYVTAALSSHARSIAATNLGIAALCRELQQSFQQSGIPLLFLKGLTVGALAYRGPLLKMGWDIDLLIDPSDLAAAADLLSDRGFELRVPDSTADLQEWHGRSKESVWQRNEAVFVELHTGLADNERLIPTIDIHSRRQLVEVVPGISLPTLADEELLAYLAVHGSSSAWFRLKWISDFAALLEGRTSEELRRLYLRSQELGADRAAGQALLLADTLFGTLGPVPALREEVANDRPTRLLCSAALRMIREAGEPTARLLGTLTIHWTQFMLKPDLAFKWSELRRQGAGLLRRSAN